MPLAFSCLRCFSHPAAFHSDFRCFTKCVLLTICKTSEYIRHIFRKQDLFLCGTAISASDGTWSTFGTVLGTQRRSNKSHFGQMGSYGIRWNVWRYRCQILRVSVYLKITCTVSLKSYETVIVMVLRVLPYKPRSHADRLRFLFLKIASILSADLFECLNRRFGTTIRKNVHSGIHPNILCATEKITHELTPPFYFF